MNISQFRDAMTKLFPEELLAEFEGDFGFLNTSNNNIATIGYATNISLEVIDQAAALSVDLIVTHHDAWDFIYGLREACVSRLKEHNISHFFIHGPLDFISFGTYAALMDVMGINRIEQHSVYEEEEFPGIGEFNEPVLFKDLVQKMRTELDEPVRAWRNNDRNVKRVGVLTGAGHATNHIQWALDHDCDTYITGEATLYSIQYAQYAGINLIAGSHTFTEIFGVKNLAEKTKDTHPELELIQLKESHFELNH
ncbi:Nif3-like dinuclear metal center hexameric protein [Planococcus lenghuensis]|uniref:GTP cyclohydrolase 1 type 2 homolog n=1 Tax=Planococcus lenghuensis TaxID=2213202 RepID=A0A1Q2L3M2_9BACL|nr:Nif3-like dinuclear metal center hexameric protein [Planococcus lenghuensis]AQQ55013.1 SMS protein [Planococcus lenghuensis]